MNNTWLIKSFSFRELVEVAKSHFACVDLVELLGILFLILACELICDVTVYDFLTLDSHGCSLLLFVPVVAAHYSCYGAWTVLDAVIPVTPVVICDNIFC